jgi:hypothetical protein
MLMRDHSYRWTSLVVAGVLAACGDSTGPDVNGPTPTETTVPSVSTSAVTGIALDAAEAGGTITDNGGLSITAKGVVWGTSQGPTITLPTKTSDGSGDTDFVSSLTGLDEGTTYYVRAYATNSMGTSYGEERSFTTLEVVVPTVSISSLTWESKATVMVNIDDSGLGTVSARGVAWSTAPNPTIEGTHTSFDRPAIGFGVQIDGWTAGTTYYLRAYATNEVGTAYSDEVVFTRPALAVGDPYLGGIVGGFDPDSDYQSGFIITDRNQGFVSWANAGPLASNLDFNGYTDWYLPSIDQLRAVGRNREAVNAGSISTGGAALTQYVYWSSSPNQGVGFDWGPCGYCVVSITGTPAQSAYVRAVRGF